MLTLCTLLSGVLGCGSEAEPPRDRHWIRLADATDATHTLVEREDIAYDEAGAPAVRLRGPGGSRWLETTIGATEWQPFEELGEGVWFAPVKTWSVGRADGGASQRLSAAERHFEHAPPDVMANSWDFPTGSFSASKRGVFLKLAPDEPLPEASVLAVRLQTRHQVDGTWRISGRRFSGEGFALHKNEAIEVALPRLPDQSVLQFATAIEPAVVLGGVASGATRFRVLLGDDVIFETSRSAAADSFEWHQVTLDSDGGPAELRFQVDGSVAHASFADPVLTFFESPPDPNPGRPDIIVFLADTFRADNMAAYGGELNLTPFLDELAGRSRVQTRAWSVTTHTLPAHATIFSGLFPHQAGVPDEKAVLSDQARTVAELLGRSGYRTGAITDSLVVSDARGISQGFGWFDESQTTLRSTLERALAFLDADDGRPTFLFVHSYRAHTPYRVNVATLEEHGSRLGIPRMNLTEQRELIMASKQLTSFTSPRAQQTLPMLIALYRGGVIDVDRGVGQFVAALQNRDFFGDGVLVFTSDHGEAFGEHTVLYHQGTPWEELARVPLLLHGAGIAPGTIDEPVSLVDLAPTLADIAGVEADPQWAGISVLSEGEERPVYTFQASGPGGSVAIIEGNRKAIGLEQDARMGPSPLLGAFDLARDPAERRDLQGEATWPKELVQRNAEGIANALTPILDGGDASLDAEEIERLKAMGYLLDE